MANRYHVGSPYGTSRSTIVKRRLIKWNQRPGPYKSSQGGVLNPRKYPTYVIGGALTSNTVILGREDTMSGDTLNPGVLLNPTVSAGSNQGLTPGATTATLTGTSSSPNTNETRTYLWTRVSGPNTPTIATPTALSTGISGLVPGTYIFKLTSTGSFGDVGSATVQITAS